MKQAIKTTSSELCGFHLCACNVGVCMHMCVCSCQKKNPFPSISLCVWNWLSHKLRIPKYHYKKKEREEEETFLVIFFWESDPGRPAPAVGGVKPVFGRGIWERECSGIGVCVRSWMEEAVIILVCTAALEPCCGTLLYCTPSAVIKTKTHRGYTRPARHCQVTNPSRHNGITAPSLVILAWSVCGLQAANCTKCSHPFTYISRNITKTRRRGWEGQTYSTYMVEKDIPVTWKWFHFFWLIFSLWKRKKAQVCLFVWARVGVSLRYLVTHPQMLFVVWIK